MNDKDDDLILILAIRQYYQLKLLDEDAVRPHSRYRKDFMRRLDAYKRRIRRRYIPRPSLHLPSMSSLRRSVTNGSYSCRVDFVVHNFGCVVHVRRGRPS